MATRSRLRQHVGGGGMSILYTSTQFHRFHFLPEKYYCDNRNERVFEGWNRNIEYVFAIL